MKSFEEQCIAASELCASEGDADMMGVEFRELLRQAGYSKEVQDYVVGDIRGLPCDKCGDEHDGPFCPEQY